MGIHRKFSSRREYYSTNRCWLKYPRKVQQEVQGTSERTHVFESIPEKSLTIASGATTIGSVGAHPMILLSKTNSYEISQKEKVYLSLYPKKTFEYSLGGYSHRERWACTRRNFILQRKEGKRKLVKWNYSHREGMHIIQGWATRRFQNWNSQTRLKWL
jgi:hypothetical protein